MYPDNYDALFKKGVVLQQNKNFEEAIFTFDKLSNKTKNFKSEICLEKGRCLLKLKRKEEAIVQISQAVDLNNEEAKKLYDKINPIVKEFIGYRTKCCDGTTSNARGSGACSHHGGVCNWNLPIYSERRKYEIKKRR